MSPKSIQPFSLSYCGLSIQYQPNCSLVCYNNFNWEKHILLITGTGFLLKNRWSVSWIYFLLYSWSNLQLWIIEYHLRMLCFPFKIKGKLNGKDHCRLKAVLLSNFPKIQQNANKILSFKVFWNKCNIVHSLDYATKYI